MFDPQEVKQFQEIVQQTTRNEIAISEQRMIGKIDRAVNDSEQRMQLAIKQLGIDIGDFITQSILPQVEDKVSKNEVKKLTAKIQEHDSILKKVQVGFIN